MLTAATVMVLPAAFIGPIDSRSLQALLLLGLFGATGLGLLLRAKVARVVAGLGFLASAVLAPVSLIQALGNVASPDPVWLFAIANAVATTLLLVWLGIRAIYVLFGRAQRASVATPRLVGGVLVVIAVNHLWLASRLGFSTDGSVAVRISTDGMVLMGFAGWPIWHVVLLALGLMMVAGPRRVLPLATTGLLVLFVGMVPLVLVTAGGPRVVGFEASLLGIVLFPVYLAWWLRDEVHRMERAGRAVGL